MISSPAIENIYQQILSLFEDDAEVNIPDYGWTNHVWISDKYSWAHLEKFTYKKVNVLHCVVMPHRYSNAPIYGFDIVEMSGNLTGMFLDLTPVDGFTYAVPDVGLRREPPAWACFFSDNFCCCKPSENDLQAGVDLLKMYIKTNLPWESDIDYGKQQQRYIIGQRSNPQTRRVLQAAIGHKRADEFIETILFPDII